MYIGVISMRYAKALLAYADEKGTEDTVYVEPGTVIQKQILMQHLCV